MRIFPLPFRRHRAILVVELLVGLIVVAMVMLGIAAIMTSVAQGWNDQDVTQSTQLQANQVYARVQSQLSGACYIGYVNAGSVAGTSALPGCLVFWQNDNFGGVEAGQPRYGEMAVIQQDPTTNSLYLYESLPLAQLNGAQTALASQATTAGEIYQASFPAQFENANFVQQVALGGPGNQPDNGTRLHVLGLQVYVSCLSSTTQLPVVEYALGFSRNGVGLTLYNTTTLKGPAAAPQ